MQHIDDPVRALIKQLDFSVPREGARVRLDIGPGPDESSIVANETGYLRFGIELLLAALEQAASDNRLPPRDLRYLITEDSDIYFDEFIKGDLANPQYRVPAAKAQVLPILAGLVTLAVLVFAIIGILTVIRSLAAISA